MTQQSLFPESIEARRQKIDGQIEWLLFGNPGGPLKLRLGADEKRVLAQIRYRRGAVNAITIAEMREALGRTSAGALTDREIKNIVRGLRLQFHLPIGSSKRGSAGGYFIMLTGEDHAILRAQVIDQVRAELEVLKAIDGPHAALELLGQLQLEVRA
jgi:hypothetical protein